MLQKSKRIILGIFIIFGVFAFCAGLYFSHHMSKNKETDLTEFQGTLLQQPREIAPFSLEGTNGQLFDNAALNNQWTLLFFGFTECGYVCPTTLAALAKMHELLVHDGVHPLPRVVMVSLDPQRDTLDRLKAYVEGFNQDFYGARGDEAQVAQMANELGIAYTKIALPHDEKNPEPLHYDIQHSGAVMLFNPKGQLAAFFTTPHQGDILAKDYTLLLGSFKALK